MRKLQIARVLSLAGGVLFATELAALDAEAGLCEQKTASTIISIVICPEGLTLEQLAGAGKAFCDGRMPCGAWIWSDPASAPEEAPENHDGLTKEEVTSAVGVWVAEQSQFISIEKVK